MTVQKEAPLRALFCGAILDEWSLTSAQKKYEEILPAFVDLHKTWKALGAKLVATLDDRLVKGPPGDKRFNWYEMWEVPDMDTVINMLAEVRTRDDAEVNLYRYMRFEVIVGPQLNDIEETVGSCLVEAGSDPVPYQWTSASCEAGRAYRPPARKRG
jgi:hypothetical protein